MTTNAAGLLRTTVAATPRNAILLFVLLQLYFASNSLSFGFWKSGHPVSGYMLVFFGAWTAVLVLTLSIFMMVVRRFNRSWLTLTVPVVLSIPFAWELWIPSIEIDSTDTERVVRILLLPATYLYFRIGLERVRATACAVVLLCVLSFAGHAGLSLSTEPTRDFETVELDKKTNIHVIMLDSLTHSAFSKEFMDIENPAADFLAALDDTIYADNMGFSENVPTKYAWGTLFNLGRSSRDSGFFSGTTPSRLTALLRDNGYRISTGYSGDYFGWHKGEFVDHYYRGRIRRLKNDLYCTTTKGKLGFCSAYSRRIFDRVFSGKSDLKSRRARGWPDTVIDLIDRAERESTGPQFSAFHIYLPGHTPGNYRSGDAKMLAEFTKFFAKRVQRARRVIEKIDRLRKKYPKSIFIISGDHGPWLSRRAHQNERRLIVLDRHGVALALLNASNLCAWSRDWLSRQRYLTPSRMLAASLACDGESRRLTRNFTDNEEFIHYGESFATGGMQGS